MKVWTREEDALLVQMTEDRVPMPKRAARLNVSEAACRSRLTRLRNSGFANPESDDIPIHVDEPESAYSAEPVQSPKAPEWSVGAASRERGLSQQIAEHKRREAQLLDELRTRDEWLSVAGSLRTVAPIVGKPRSKGSRRHGVPVMMMSDWHVEELVRPETVNGLNRYDLSIAEECIECMADAFVWMLLDSRYDCREGVLWLGGDLFSGHIHDELAEQNQLSPVEVVMWLQARLLRLIGRVLAETNLERIIIVCNDGNHGRLTHKMRCATRTKNSLEWLLYQQLARHFANEPRLQFQIAEGVSNYLKIYDTTICFQHGDTFKYGGGVGGLLIPVRRGANELRKYRHFDHLVIGHFHQEQDMGDVIVNGSAIGITPYGLTIKATPEPRKQHWFMVDQTYGKTISTKIQLPQYTG